MRTLVTGAPGWLGSRLVEILAGDGNRDPFWARFSRAPERRVRCLVLPGYENGIPPAWDVERVTGDVRDPKTLAGALEGVDTVLHCVGVIHPRRVRDFYDINTQGTKNLIAEAVRKKVRRFVFVSSNSPAGGQRDRRRLHQEDDPPAPYQHYGRSKWLAEEAVRDAGRQGGIETVILRPCWYYGPGQPLRQTRFFRMILSGRPILFGDGHSLRSMSYIDNVIQGILLAESNPQAAGKLFWIADERPYETIEIYETVARILGVSLKVRYVPRWVSQAAKGVDALLQSAGIYQQEIHVAGEMIQDIACSIERARRELGYRPFVSLEEGMRRSIEWCRKAGAL